MAVLLKMFCLPSERRFILKRNHLLPKEVNSFLLEQTPFEKGLQCRNEKVVENVLSVSTVLKSQDFILITTIFAVTILKYRNNNKYIFVKILLAIFQKKKPENL